MITTSGNRQKAWLGAAIGAAAGLLGSVGSSIFGNNAAKKQQRIQQAAQNRSDTLQMAQNLTAGYGDQSYVDDLQQRVTFKCGGRKRRKAEEGGKFDIGSMLTGIMSGIGNVATGAINANTLQHQHVDSRESLANTPKTEVVQPDYVNTVGYQDRLASLLRCGGKIRHR